MLCKLGHQRVHALLAGELEVRVCMSLGLVWGRHGGGLCG